MTITSVQDLGREGIDERQFRLGFRIIFPGSGPPCHHWPVRSNVCTDSLSLRRLQMRRLLLVLGATCLAVPTIAQTPASGKMATSWKCAAPSPANAVPVGDEPTHMYVVEQVKCTASKGEIAGVKEKEGTATEFA